jgi:hypothetical protein
MWNDSAQANRNYFWINFTQGNQTLFMDPYVVFYPRERRNLCPSPVQGIGSAPDPRWDNVRGTMGYIRAYADRLNLAAMAPLGDLSSTRHALVSTALARTGFHVYMPSGSFTRIFPALTDSLHQWTNPATGESGWRIGGGGSTPTFTSPSTGMRPLLEEKCTGRRPKIETIKTAIALQYIRWFSDDFTV